MCSSLANAVGNGCTVQRDRGEHASQRHGHGNTDKHLTTDPDPNICPDIDSDATTNVYRHGCYNNTNGNVNSCNVDADSDWNCYSNGHFDPNGNRNGPNANRNENANHWRNFNCNGSLGPCTELTWCRKWWLYDQQRAADSYPPRRSTSIRRLDITGTYQETSDLTSSCKPK